MNTTATGTQIDDNRVSFFGSTLVICRNHIASISQDNNIVTINADGVFHTVDFTSTPRGADTCYRELLNSLFPNS